jgi:predicted dehydrogenase
MIRHQFPLADPDLEQAPVHACRAMDRVGMAVVGYGYWGPNLARNVAGLPATRLVCVCDRDETRLRAAVTRHPGVGVTTDFDDVLCSPEVEVVAIATPPGTHHRLARQALLAGKHVLVEKPLATSSALALDLVELAERKGLVLMVDHTFVYTPAVQRIKELVDAGELGRLYYWDSVRVNLGLFQHDVSVLEDLAVHDLAILDHVLGRAPVAVNATGTAHIPGKPMNTAYLTCVYDDDVLAHLHVNWLAPVKVRRTLIGGDRRMIVYDDVEPSEKVKVYDTGITLDSEAGRFERQVGYRTGDIWTPHLPLAEALQVEVEHLVSCVRLGVRPLTDGWAGYRVLCVLEAALRSAEQRGRPVDLNWSALDARSLPRSSGPAAAHPA